MKLDKEQFMTTIYNLILNPNIQETERDILVRFKNRIQKYSDFNNEVGVLAEDIRLLSIKNIGVQTLSPDIVALYKEISYHKALDKQLPIGLISKIGY